MVISYPSILATWHAYNSVTFPYAKVQAPCMNDNVVYVYMYIWLRLAMCMPDFVSSLACPSAYNSVTFPYAKMRLV